MLTHRRPGAADHYTDPARLGYMQEFILTHGSYLAIVLILALTGAGLPLPEEVPIVAAGVLSSAAVHKLNPWLAFASCLLGALLGDSLMYGIGRFLGKTRLRQHPWIAHLLHEEREKRMEYLIRRHGLKVFLLSRFLVGVRSPIYLASGVMRVPFRRFLLVDAMCAAIVVGTFFWLSHFFGGWIGPLFRQSQLALTIVALSAVVLITTYYLIWKRFRHQLHLDDDRSDEEPEDDGDARLDGALDRMDLKDNTASKPASEGPAGGDAAADSCKRHLAERM